MLGRGEAAQADRRRGGLRIELGDPDQGRAVAMRKMVEAAGLEPLPKGGVARVLPASLGETLSLQDQGVQIGHAKP